MSLWILVIYLVNGSIEQGKFLNKSNCHKVGKQIVGHSKYMKYKCTLKRFKAKNDKHFIK